MAPVARPSSSTPAIQRHVSQVVQGRELPISSSTTNGTVARRRCGHSISLRAGNVVRQRGPVQGGRRKRQAVSQQVSAFPGLIAGVHRAGGQKALVMRVEGKWHGALAQGGNAGRQVQISKKCLSVAYVTELLYYQK